MSKRVWIVFILVLLLLTGALTLFYFSKRVPLDPSNSGNTAGNLQNKGLFFEMDGKVYFANASDDHCLYSMNVDETDPKRLTAMGAKYISGADGYLYFYMDSTKKSSKVSGLGAATNQFGVYRCKTNGGDQTCMVRDFCGELQLCGEYIYYQIKTEGDGTLHKIKCNKTDEQKVADELISPLCYDNGTIIYTGVKNDHSLHTFSTATDTSGNFISGSFFFPVVQDGYVYYLNGQSNYSLWRANLSNGEQQLITSDRIDCFTMDREHIYYSFSNANSPSLKRCDIDGSNTIVLYQGVVNSINLTSRYVYFKVYGDDNLYYHIPLDLSSAASPFILKVK